MKELFHQMRPMTRSASVAALMLAIATTAHAEYFTYSDWSKQPADFRAAYIAGLYDALISMAETNGGQNRRALSSVRSAGKNA